MSERGNEASALGLAWRHGRRSAGRGEWLILLVALAVAVAAVTAVSLLTDRVRSAMVRQGATTLAADLRLSTRAPLEADRARALAATGVETAAVTVFPSTLSDDDAVTLVSVKAVERAYPLRGTLTLRRGPPGTATETVAHGPPPGRVWVAQRVLDEQDRGVGDRLQLGDAELTIDAVLVTEPDRDPGFAGLAPRVMIAAADIEATGLLGFGSRAEYATLIAGDAPAVAAARAALDDDLATGERLQTPAESNRALSRALSRADVFLDLAALVAVVLAGVAIALTARRHAESRLDEIALLKTLGARRGLIARVLAWQLVLIGVLGIAGGLILGAAAQAGIGRVIAGAFEIALPGPAWRGLWPGPIAGALLLAGFAWPALARARRTPPARVLARALADDDRRAWRMHAGAIASVAVLAALATRDAMLTAWVLGGALAGAAALALGALGLLWCVERARTGLGGRLGPGIRLGLAALSRRRAASVLQIVAFGVGLIMLFLLVIVRGDLLAGWRADIAADAPNRFLINITPDQQPQVADFLAEHGIEAPAFFPLVRARLTTVDGRAIESDPALAESAGELARRELNLSWTDTLKADNRLLEGRWWQPADRGEPHVSIDESVAERLGVGIGDTLGFDLAGRTFTTEIRSIRSIDWSSLEANFYVLFPPGFLDDYPSTYITSFHLPDDRRAVLGDLVREFNNVSVIDIAAILDQLTTLIDRVSLAVELVFGFTLAAGLVVLLAAMQASRSARRREAALLRALGTRARWLRQAVVVECLLLGACAAVLAAVVAQIAAVVLATQVLDLGYTWRPGVWLVAVTSATIAIALAGLASLGDVLRQPAWTSLRAED